MERILITIAAVVSRTQAISFCSINDTTVHCYPCIDICTSNTHACFRCPVHCTDPCEFVCSPWCRHQTCEYQRGQLMCSEGCQDGRAGISCQEFCPPDCQSCDQFTSECKEVIGSPKRTEHQWLVIGPVFAVILLLAVAAGLCYKRRGALGRLNRPLAIERLAMSRESGHRPAMEEEDDPRFTSEVTTQSTPGKEYEDVGNTYVESVRPDQLQGVAPPCLTHTKEDVEKYKYMYLTPVPLNLP